MNREKEKYIEAINFLDTIPKPNGNTIKIKITDYVKILEKENELTSGVMKVIKEFMANLEKIIEDFEK